MSNQKENIYMHQHSVEIYRWTNGILNVEKQIAETFLHALAIVANVEAGILCKVYNELGVLVHTNSENIATAY